MICYPRKTLWIAKQSTNLIRYSSGSLLRSILGNKWPKSDLNQFILLLMFWTGAGTTFVGGWAKESGRSGRNVIVTARTTRAQKWHVRPSGACSFRGAKNGLRGLSVRGRAIRDFLGIVKLRKYCNLLYIQRNLYQEEHTKACVRDECVKADTCVTGTRN